MFVDRVQELAELNSLLETERGLAGKFIAVYGRRRIGKTTLLVHWAKQTKRPSIYCVGRRETADACRTSLARVIWRWAYPEETSLEPPSFASWEQLFTQLAQMLGNQPLILIWDEFPYAVESDPTLPSHLRAAWDHQFKDKPLTLVLAGSHIGMMVDLMKHQAPLYGRFTGQLSLGPLPFSTLAEFFPQYSAAERVATYAVLGGVPAYLEQFSPNQNLSKNIRQHLFQRVGMFHSEPMLLISDLVRETRNYEAALQAVATGHRTPSEIAKITGIVPSNLSPYLRRLIELGLIERRVPATIPADQRRQTTTSRYHLRDPYLRFYYRLIAPNLEMIELGLTDLLWERISEQFRAFVGLTAFEELCREWTLIKARKGQLPFDPELVGSHWDKDSQIDVVAINWREKAILLGECKWGVGPVGRSVLRELVDKTPLVAPKDDWQVYYVLFARDGFTEAARAFAGGFDMVLVDLAILEGDLASGNMTIQ
ncbi:MAG: ATP-binding protein [Anaerolineales bacterium]|nr:ATP-binding protein [Anaerolineales bacterium]